MDEHYENPLTKKKEKDEHGWGFLEHGISKDWRNRKGWTWFDLLIP